MKPLFTFNCVMLIDDSDIDNWMAEHLIRRTGLAENTIVFNTASAALEHLKDAEGGATQLPLPELIFLDLTMPVQNGYDFLEKYEELELPDIIIYILTASILRSDPEKAEHYKSIRGFIIKPLTETVLIELKALKP